MERATGIEPVSSVWKTEVLPLHNARARFFYMAMLGAGAIPILEKNAKNVSHAKQVNAVLTFIYNVLSNGSINSGPLARFEFTAVLTR